MYTLQKSLNTPAQNTIFHNYLHFQLEPDRYIVLPFLLADMSLSQI